MRQEVQLQAKVNWKDAIERPDLYKVNKIDDTQLTLNLLALLSQDKEKEDSSVLFQNEEEMMEALRNDSYKHPTPNESDVEPIKFNDPLVVVWENRNGKCTWYVGFFWGKNPDGTIRVNHLERNGKRHNCWKRARMDTDDIEEVHDEQILPIGVHGDWFFEKEVPLYMIENWAEIQATFEEHFT